MTEDSDSSGGGVLTGHASDESSRVFSAAPFISDLGIKLESLAPGECVSSLEIADRHLQQDGFVHAGVLATIADHTSGAAGATMLRAGQIVLTAEFKVNLMRAARGRRLTCRGRVVKPGSRLIFAESAVHCEGEDAESLVATASVTLAVVDVSADSEGT